MIYLLNGPLVHIQVIMINTNVIIINTKRVAVNLALALVWLISVIPFGEAEIAYM